jgi:hypothetical protein
MDSKFQRLGKALPEGQLANRAWLLAHGMTSPRIDYALRAGNLETVVHGVYRRSGPLLKWEQVVYSLNAMGWPGHVGGRSAFELQGKAHFLAINGVKQIELHGAGPAPAWLEKLPGPYRMVAHNKKLFASLPPAMLEIKPFGVWDWPIPYSSPELALLEMLGEFRGEEDFGFADPFFEGAATLRPDRVQSLLENCVQVKAKRLFLWYTKRHRHPWVGKIDKSRINLGSGKREVAKGGALDMDFLITIPREMVHDAGQPLY